MSKLKTPAPGKWRTVRTARPNDRGEWSITSDCGDICRLDWNIPLAHAEATANVLAASKELLAALEGVIRLLDLLNIPGSNDPIEAAVFKARSAIAKATGIL